MLIIKANMSFWPGDEHFAHYPSQVWFNIILTICLRVEKILVWIKFFLLLLLQYKQWKDILSFYRSPDQWDAIDFQIHMNTPLEKLTMLKERLQKYIEGLPQIWYPDFRMACKDIEDSTKMKMGIWPRHRLNFQANFSYPLTNLLLTLIQIYQH